MHPDIPDEQGYFDRALELRDRLEANLGRAATLAADAKTATELRRRVGAMGVVDPGGAVAFGRIDADGNRWYIGKGAIWDEDNELVVVNWQAPIAAPFYTATPDDPEGLERRRIYQCENNRILDIDEMVFTGLEQAILGSNGTVNGSANGAGGSTRAPSNGVAAGPVPARPGPTADGPTDTAGGPGGAARAAVNGSTGPGAGGGAPAVNGSGSPVGLDGGFGTGAPPGPDDDADGPATDGTGEAGTGDTTGMGDTAGSPRSAMSDALLTALGRTRSGELGDIVATIQAAQYDIITRDIEQLLVVQGGPGTGKTVVGLHRVSWMLYNRRDRWQANDVLIVGPNPAFIRYISAVLPSLGEEAVVQLPVTGLGPRVPVGRVDPLEVRRLKGDRRMLRLLLRAIRNRQKPQRGPIDLKVAGRTVRLDGDRIMARTQQLAGQPHNEARRELRSFVIDEVQTFFTRRGLRGLAAIEDMAQSDASREIDSYLERIWPAMTPQSFLVDLLSTRRRLEAAGLGLLTSDEISMLSIPAGTKVSNWTWSVDDVPLLDMADALLNGTPATYEHIVVDEAQDLSPMQFESIRRRSRTGWMTVLGDLAQATSPWSPTSWEEVALHLRRDRVPTEIAELNLGYRLPQEVHDVAMRLLPEIAPRLRAPEAVRPSGHEVTVTATGPDRLAVDVVEAVRKVLGTGLVGVITAERDRAAVGQALDAAGFSWAPELQARAAPIVLLGAEEAKGLEFDNVVVVEPSEVAGESPQGLRALFVALTRTTSRLILVHTEPLPGLLELDSPLPPPEPEESAAPIEGREETEATEATGQDGAVAAPGPLEGPPPPPPPPGHSLPPATGAVSMGPWDPVEGQGPGAVDVPGDSPAGPGPADPVGSTDGAVSAGDGRLHGPASPDSVWANGSAPDEGATEPGGSGAEGTGSLAALDDAMARAIAGKLAETLSRYVTPALVPLVLEEMRKLLAVEDGDVTVVDVRSGPGAHDP